MIHLPTVSMLLYFESKNSLFSEKLQKEGTWARHVKMLSAKIMKLFKYVKQ